MIALLRCWHRIVQDVIVAIRARFRVYSAGCINWWIRTIQYCTCYIVSRNLICCITYMMVPTGILCPEGRLQTTLTPQFPSCTFQKHRDRLRNLEHGQEFAAPNPGQDRLFEAPYKHRSQYGGRCSSCETTKLMHRPARIEEHAARFIFHRGVATGNAVVQDSKRRDQTRDGCNGVLCIEMETAGVADSHKGDAWRLYAAGNAVVFARERLI